MSFTRMVQILVILTAALIVVLVQASCDHNDLAPEECGKITSYNAAGPGTISAQATGLPQDVSLLLELNPGQDSQHIVVGNSAAGNNYTFSGLPSGTLSVHWIVSGCPANPDEQVVIPGPQTIAVP